MYQGSLVEIFGWLSVDPLYYHPNQVDKSPYAYTWNNPVNLVDPDGRCPDCPDASSAREGDLANPHGQQEYVFANGEWTGVGGTIDGVTVRPQGEESNNNSSNPEPPTYNASVLVLGGAISAADGPLPFGEAIAATIIASYSLYYAYQYASYQYDIYQMSKDSGKNERHGDGGRAKTKAERQIQDLEASKAGKSKAEKKKIDRKIRNIRENAERKAKGEEHSRANKR